MVFLVLQMAKFLLMFELTQPCVSQCPGFQIFFNLFVDLGFLNYPLYGGEIWMLRNFIIQYLLVCLGSCLFCNDICYHEFPFLYIGCAT